MKITPMKVITVTAILSMIAFIMVGHSHTSPALHRATTSHSGDGDVASGDTNNEVLEELTARYQKVQQQNQKMQSALDALETQAQNKSPEEDTTLSNQTISALKRAQQQSTGDIQQLKQQIQNVENKHTNTSAHYTVNDRAGDVATTQMITTVSDVSIQSPTLKSARVTSTTDNVRPLLAPLSKMASTTQGGAVANAQSETKPKPIPVYTIPSLSTMAHTSLMTSLIGEVPTSSNSLPQPPFPFEAIIGRKDLMSANGIALPAELSGMKISGYAVGVGSFMDNLSCTRAYITQVLFVFNDGHFTTVGHSHNNATASSVSPGDALGYLSDSYGNPCIPGTYISNAWRVLGVLTGTGIIQGVGQGLSQAQSTTMTGFDGSSSALTGSVGKYALGYGAASGANKAVDWVTDRVKNTFDIVYVPASANGKPTQVVANFTKTIPIDFNPIGRQTREQPYSKHKGFSDELD